MQQHDVGVRDTGGNLPPFWNREAAFFANLLALFFGNEEGTDRLKNEVGEVDSYGGRLIPILNLLFRGTDNVLILERKPDEALCGYFRDRLGLVLPKLEILSHRDYEELGHRFKAGEHHVANDVLAEVARHNASWIDGYVTDTTLTQIADHLGRRTITTVEGSHRGNNKLLLFEAIRQLGLPHVQTELAPSREDIPSCLERLASAGFEEAVLKAQIGASGIGMAKVEGIRSIRNPEDLPGSVTEDLFFEGTCMVQGWMRPGLHGVRAIHSPSVQMFLDDESVFLYDVTEQILSHDSVHEGNVSPPPYLIETPSLREELFRQGTLASRWLHGEGYRGTASTDFLIVEREGSPTPEIYICEINARVTGATYPSVLARHFTPRGSWLMRNLRLEKPLQGQVLLDLLEAPGHLFVRGRTSGILPINFNFGEEGLIHKGQFLCLGQSPDHCAQLLQTAEDDLPVDWAADRD